MATLESVSIYSVYFLITTGLRGLIYSVTSSLTSFLGNILAKGEKDTLTRNFYRIEWAMHTITLLCFSSAAILIVPFVRVYTAGINDANYIVPYFPYLMCAAVACRCLQLPYNIVVQAAGHFKETQNSAIIEPVLDIVFSVLLVSKFGLSGVAMGFLISITYRMLYLSRYLTRHILNTSRRQLVKRYVVDIIMVAAIVAACSFIPECQLSYFSWTLMAAKVIGVAAIVTAVINIVFYRQLTADFFNSALLVKFKKTKK